ncbi:MAG: hypothetical protein AAFO73_04895 [Pseudomonadota bacterium]
MRRGAKKWDFGAADAAGYAQAVSFDGVRAAAHLDKDAKGAKGAEVARAGKAGMNLSAPVAFDTAPDGPTNRLANGPADGATHEAMDEASGGLRLVPSGLGPPVSPGTQQQAPLDTHQNGSPEDAPSIERQNIAPAVAEDGRWTTGVEAIDAHLPAGHINRSGLHEVEPLRATDMPSLTGFSFALLSRLRSNAPIIWCVTAEQVGEYGHLYAHGVQRFGLSPAQIIFSKVSKAVHLQFAMEEALKTEGVTAVLGEGPRPCFTGSRRLSLIARQQGRPCLLLAGGGQGERGSAAMTRWQVAPSPGVENPNDPFGPGLPTWRLALTRVRGGSPMPALSSTTGTKSLQTPPGIQPATQPARHLARQEGARHGAEQSRPASERSPTGQLRIVWDEQTHSFHSAAVFCRGAVQERGSPQSQPPQALVG